MGEAGEGEEDLYAILLTGQSQADAPKKQDSARHHTPSGTKAHWKLR